MSLRCARPLAALALLLPAAPAQIVFAPPQSHVVSHPTLAPMAGDLDFDGDADVVLLGAYPGAFFSTSMSVLIGDGRGGLGAAVEHLLSASTVGEGQIVDIADFDGPATSVPDGLPDVLLGGVGFGTMQGIGWKAGHGDGTFGNPFNYLSGFNLAGGAIVDVTTTDLEGDGDLDIVALEGGAFIFAPGKLVQGVSTGTGGFSIGPVGSTHSAATFLAVADLNADGRPDAVTNNESGGVLSVFDANPAGGFAAAESVAVGGQPRELQCTDLDQDGDADVVVANSLLDAVQVLAGDGTGALGAPAAFAAGDGPSRLVLGDLDGDGATDALASAANGEVVVLRGAGDGTLAHVATVSSPDPSLGLALADLDGDGDLDATVARGGPLGHADGTMDVLINATYPAGSPFADLGFALSGTHGYPIQLAEGTLVAGETFGFHLLGAKESALATHVVGLSPLMLPYKGGTMVPAPDLLNFVLTDAAGEVHLVGPWPAGGSGATLWLQFWVKDPGGIKGRAASSAVTATIP